MEMLKIATAQFEHKNGDKNHNLQVIEQLSARAAEEGAKVICFHECSVTGYAFARNLSKHQLLDIAEHIPGWPEHPEADQNCHFKSYYRLAGLLKKMNTITFIKHSFVLTNRAGCQIQEIAPFH